MNKGQKMIVLLLTILLTAGWGFCPAFADDEHKKEHRSHKRERHHSERDLPMVNEPVYAENCGACHFTYQPELLPSGSWIKILANLQNHFGESVELDSDSATSLLAYLKHRFPRCV